SFKEAAQLSKALYLGQWLLIPISLINSAMWACRQRWSMIRELSCLRTAGSLKARRGILIGRIPYLGLQLTLLTLSASVDTELICRGRNIMVYRDLAIDPARLTKMGIAATTTCLALVLFCIILDVK
uniref:hypothetical protein n=1 Tax=Sphingomonas bacterium TaxID=1895847 RepID=UPI00262DABF1